MKLLEYMAMARAVIAPCQANIADLIQDRVNGVLFDGSRPGELASIVVDLVKHPAERQRLGDTARAIVQVQRTWTAVAEKILAELARVRPTVGCIGA
jgi:glycosyltransferase involved in cell wall biosynthesis